MPELPEVETTVKQLRREILGRKIEGVWSDFKKIIKKPKDFEEFRKELAGKKIKKIERRGKNILFRLSGGRTLLIHQKLTGHLLVGKWVKERGKWRVFSGALSEKINSYIHLLFVLGNGQMMALSDLRKFAKVELWETERLRETKEFKDLGPEPLDKEFTLEQFQESLKAKKGKIKQILMDQKVVAGIGNIYSDEILWAVKVSPFKRACKLSKNETQAIYRAMRRILSQAIRLKGASISDFRDIRGERGRFDRVRKVYQKEGERCPRCGSVIKRQKVGGRSAHYCPRCQKL